MTLLKICLKFSAFTKFITMRNLYVFCLVTAFWIKGISSTELLTVTEGSTVNLVCPTVEHTEYTEQLAKAHIDGYYLKSKDYSSVAISR